MRMRAPWYLLIILYAHDVMIGGDNYYHLKNVGEKWRHRVYEETGIRLCGGYLPFMRFYSNLPLIKEERPNLNTPSSLKFIESAYKRFLFETEKLSLTRQQEELGRFFINVIKPRKNDFIGFYVDSIGYGTICDEISKKSQCNKSLIAAEKKVFATIEKPYNSLKDFTYAFGQYKTLSEAQQKDYTGKQFWKGALQYGTLAQIEELAPSADFSSEYVDAVYKCMMRHAIDEQISLVGTLYKKYAGFAAYIDSKKTEQNNLALPISLRSCIARNQSEAFFAPFKGKNGEINNQLFMNILQPFLTIKNVRYQNAVVNILETWSGTVCPDNSALLHSNYDKTWALINDKGAGAFKKLLESDAVGVAITQWWAKLQMFIWKEYAAKKDPNKLFDPMKQKSLNLMKDIESAFMRISSESAISFHHTDNNVRATMHGGILCLLLAEGTTTKEKAYALCERALKSGINIAEGGYMRYITSALPDSSLFLKLVEPYSESNLDICYALGQLYEEGYFIKMDRDAGKNKVDVWLKRDVKKAKNLYIKMLKKGDVRAIIRWFSLTYEGANNKGEEEKNGFHYYTMQFLSALCEDFPNKLLLRVYRAHFMCKSVSEIIKTTVNERAIVYMDELEKEIDFIGSNLITRCPYFTSLKTSYKSLNYAAQRALHVSGANEDEHAAMAELARCAYATYVLSADKNSFLLPVISNYFDASVFVHLKQYAEKLLNKDPKAITKEDLHILATAGYTVFRTNKQCLDKNDELFIGKILQLSSHKDMQIQWPPIMHIIALRSSKAYDQDDNLDAFWRHVKAALQEDETPENSDPVACHEVEQVLETLSKSGSALAQMYLLKHNKNALRETVKKLLSMQKQLIVPTESFSDYVKKINECGGYALLKERFTASKCAVCGVDTRRLLFSWIDLLMACYSKAQIAKIASKDSKHEQFFNDMKLFNVDTQQE
jgi:TPR repeat protein